MTQLLFLEHIQNALQSFRSTRLRTLLTTIGVAIGVASVTTILALSGGVTNVISSQVTELGGNIAVVRPDLPSVATSNLTSSVNQQSYVTSSISEKDVTSIRSLPGVKAAAPLMLINGNLSTNDSKGQTVTGTIVATSPELEKISKLPIDDGQFIDSVTNSDTAVIGSQLAIDLFGTNQPIGQTFTIRKQTFTIIGVLKRLNNPINYNSIDFDRSVIISLESGKLFHEGIAQIQQINIQADTAEALPGALKAINAQLLKNHQGERDFAVLSGATIAQPTSEFFGAITSVMTVIAVISLIVGGIGIMNIMLVSVAERTREIGLRKSVGASNSNIVWQFMVEALMLSLIGGVIGYVGGYILAFAVSTLLPFDPAFTWQIAVASLGMSIVVGITFGLYPAIKAARKDPIESLRQYH